MRAGLSGAALKTKLLAGQKAQLAAAQPLLFSVFADRYLVFVQQKGLKSANSIESRLTRIKQHFGDRLVADIRTGDIDAFLADLRQPAVLVPGQQEKRVRANATINRYRSVLVQMFNWGVTRDYIERTPFSKAGVRKALVEALREDNKRDRRLSADEEARLLAAAAPHLKLLTTTALYTGMRQGEQLALTWADVTDKPGWIRLRGETAKSGKTRWVPIHPSVQAVLDFLRTDADGQPKAATVRVFSNEVGEPLAFPKTAWKLALQRANIHDLHWHDLRHEYASRLAEAGTSAPEVQELLGHASIVTTQRYFTARRERLRAAVLALPDPSHTEVSQNLHTTAVRDESEKLNPRKSLN